MNKLQIIALFHYIVLLANDLLWKCFGLSMCADVAPGLESAKRETNKTTKCIVHVMCTHESVLSLNWKRIFGMHIDQKTTMIATLRSNSCIICSDSVKCAFTLAQQTGNGRQCYAYTPELVVCVNERSFKIRCVWCERAVMQKSSIKIIM